MLLVLPPEVRVEAVLPGLLADPAIRHYALPPLWALDGAGVDLPAAMPACRSVTLETLEDVVGTLVRLCDEAQLDRLVRRVWGEVDERVRQYYLQLGIGRTLATIFKAAPATVQREPPESFRRDRIHENAFEIQYRLAQVGEAGDARAPAHEGSLVLYPFDPSDLAGRSEHGAEPGAGAVLEVFAYASGRAQHRQHWQMVAARERWQLVDPLLGEPD
jgi:hypothetical protein